LFNLKIKKDDSCSPLLYPLFLQNKYVKLDAYIIKIKVQNVQKTKAKINSNHPLYLG